MIQKLTDKYVFFDVNGTLSEYRYKDILYGVRCFDGILNRKEVIKKFSLYWTNSYHFGKVPVII